MRCISSSNDWTYGLRMSVRGWVSIACTQRCVFEAYVEFFGCRYSIFRAPTVYRLVKCVQTQSAHRLPPVPTLKELARGILDDYYACFEERFAVIGHPFSHRVPLNIPGVPEPDESAILASGDWTVPEHKWDSTRLRECFCLAPTHTTHRLRSA